MQFKLRDFKENGYSVHLTENIDKHASTWSKYFCQKRIRDGAGDTKYFINIYISDMRLWDVWHKKMRSIYLNAPTKSLTIKLQLDVLDFKAIFNYKEEDVKFLTDTITTDISLHSGDWLRDVPDIERVVDKMFDNLICINYSD